LQESTYSQVPLAKEGVRERAHDTKESAKDKAHEIAEGAQNLGHRVKAALHLGSDDKREQEQMMHKRHVESPAPEGAEEVDVIDDDKTAVGGYAENGDLIAYVHDSKIYNWNAGNPTQVDALLSPTTALLQKECTVGGLTFKRKRWSDEFHVLDTQGQQLLTGARSGNSWSIKSDLVNVVSFLDNTLTWSSDCNRFLGNNDNMHMFAIGCAVNRVCSLQVTD